MLNKVLLAVTFSMVQVAALAASPVRVVIFPLEDSSESEALSWLGEGVATSISRQIAGREVMPIDRSERLSLVEHLDLPPGAQLSRASMIRVAQRGAAHLIVTGVYSGDEQHLKISIQSLNVRTLRLSGEISANGSLATLPEMENELAWLILSNSGYGKGISRERFRGRIRKASNSSYASYIASLDADDENDRLRLLLKAIEGRSDFPEARFDLGSLHFRKGDCSNAVVHLAFSLDDPAFLSESQFMSGLCYLEMDQPSKAVTAFSRILANSRFFEVLNNLGAALLRKGEPLQALSFLMEAEGFGRESPTLTLNLALARHLSGSVQAARNILEEGVKAYPKDGMLHFALGSVLRRQGESDKAVESVSRARALGVDTEKMQNQDPKTWAKAIPNWSGAQQ